MLSRYRILGKLGAGARRGVRRAEEISLHRPVARKFLSGTSLSQEHTRAGFLREVRTAAALRHPKVCTIHEVGEVESGGEARVDRRTWDRTLGSETQFVLPDAPISLGSSADSSGAPTPCAWGVEVFYHSAEVSRMADAPETGMRSRGFLDAGGVGARFAFRLRPPEGK